jgi:hypothetical protein
MVCFFAALAELIALLPYFFGVCGASARCRSHLRLQCLSNRKLVIIRNFHVPRAVFGKRPYSTFQPSHIRNQSSCN